MVLSQQNGDLRDRPMARKRSLSAASEALETSSRRKISCWNTGMNNEPQDFARLGLEGMAFHCHG